MYLRQKVAVENNAGNSENVLQFHIICIPTYFLTSLEIEISHRFPLLLNNEKSMHTIFIHK